MWPALFRSSSLPAIEQTLQFTERRHALLAGNVANADTPGYQTRDLSVTNFQTALKDAMRASRESRNTEQGSSPRNGVGQYSMDDTKGRYQGLSSAQAVDNVRESMKQILYHDGSDVGLETQVTEIAKNQSMHATAIAILRNQYQIMRMAISESVNV